jgi:hypothetical protein
MNHLYLSHETVVWNFFNTIYVQRNGPQKSNNIPDSVQCDNWGLINMTSFYLKCMSYNDSLSKKRKGNSSGTVHWQSVVA